MQSKFSLRLSAGYVSGCWEVGKKGEAREAEEHYHLLGLHTTAHYHIAGTYEPSEKIQAGDTVVL